MKFAENRHDSVAKNELRVRVNWSGKNPQSIKFSWNFYKFHDNLSFICKIILPCTKKLKMTQNEDLCEFANKFTVTLSPSNDGSDNYQNKFTPNLNVVAIFKFFKIHSEILQIFKHPNALHEAF